MCLTVPPHARVQQTPIRDVKENKPDAPQQPQRKRKLSFNEKHLLETLPKTISGLHDEAGALQRKLDDPTFFSRDRVAFEQATTALGGIQVKLAEAEDRWLELEILREELSGGELA